MTSWATAKPRAFFRWWIGELGATLPAPIRETLFPAEAHVRIRLAGSGLSAWLAGGKRDGERLPIGAATDAPAAAAEIARAVRKNRTKIGKAIVELPEDAVLDPVVDLPIEASGNLTEVLASEIDRQTPFSAEEVYYAFQVLGSDEHLESIKVKLTITPKKEVERAVEIAKSAGLAVTKVTPPDPTRGDSINLLPPALAPRPARAAAGMIAVLLGIVAILAVVLAQTQLSGTRQILDAADKAIAGLRSQNAELSSAIETQQQLRAVYDRLRSQKNADFSAIGLLSEITRAVPDDSWLTQMQVNSNRIILMGFTRQSTELMRALERSPLFSSVRFSAPVTRDNEKDLERFHITLTVERPSQS